MILLAPANTKMDNIAAPLAATKMDAPYVTYLGLVLYVVANKLCQVSLSSGEATYVIS